MSAADMLKTGSMRATTIGRVIFNDLIPEDIRKSTVGNDGVLDKDAIKKVLTHVAHKYPDDYVDISYKLLRLGVKGSVETNTSFGLEDLESPVDKQKILAEVQAQIAAVDDDPSLSDSEKEKKRIAVYDKWGKKMPEIVFEAAMKRGSGLAKMVASGARGSKGQLSSNIGADFLVSDASGRPIPIPILHNYSEGLDPAEYFAASYGTRLGLIATKFSVQDGGYFAKQLAGAASDLIVTEEDCETKEGLPSDLNDKSNIGAVLAREVAGVKAGTVITPKITRLIESSGYSGKIVVRSPVSCQTTGGGVCSTCAGIREKNRFPSLGENIGLNAASGIAEPVTQSLLSTKHSAGVASAGGASQVTGFKQIDALAQVPKTYPFAATLSMVDGAVESVSEAPQGGQFITVAGQTHYVPEGREIKVSKGDVVEEGDVLSSGTPNPAEIVRYKGVGAGRAYFINALQQALRDNGTSADRRNVEVMSRAIINHVRIGDEDLSGRYLPDDVVEYSAFAQDYIPDADTREVELGKAKNMYLQKPVLHYSIGTRITPSVIKTMKEVGQETLSVSPRKPNFSPEMVRLSDNPAYKPDFMVHTGFSNVKRNLVEDVQSGTAGSDMHGRFFQPPLARGVEFGRPPKDVVGY